VKRIDAGELVHVALALVRHQNMAVWFAAEGIPFSQHDSAARHTVPVLMKFMRTLENFCLNAELPVSLSMVVKLKATIQSEVFKLAELEASAEQILATMRNELSLRVCLLVDPSRIRYYDKPLDGWNEVIASFPSCQRDAEEASKALALNRHTASVFHCMRAVESGLKALSSEIGIAYEHKSWDPVLKSLAHIAETDYQQLESRWKGQRQRYLDARERLTAIKDALRNPTMHVRGFYDADNAEDVYRSTRSFLKNLSSWLKDPSP
jgi:HEPN domain-containing protein